MAVDIDVFEANNPQAGCNVFIIGNQALVMDHFEISPLHGCPAHFGKHTDALLHQVGAENRPSFR